MQQAVELVLAYMEGLRCPRALTVAILVRYGEWDQVTSLEADPGLYPDASAYRKAVMATDLLRKIRGVPLSVDPKQVALQKWWDAERQCYRSNERLSPYLFGRLFADCDEGVAEFFSAVRKKIRSWIGSRPPTTLIGRFGPGATYSNSASESLVPDKLSSGPTFTPASWHFLVDWSSTWWATACAEAGRTPVSVRGNIFFTVPKSARTERSCAKEPSLNGYYQMAVGRALRHALRRIGIDLERGQDIHREIARSASIDGSFATVDLSSASDTICTNLVKLVLPIDWWNLLSDLRSPMTRVNGKWVRLEKFSSMGNGFTFELETLIFAAIAAVAVGDSAIPGHNLFVYGDDIIVPTESFENVRAALEFCGFSLNPRKSFHKGAFRESCGGDYYNGEAVRPFLLEEFPNEPHEYIAWANGLRRAALQSGIPMSHQPDLLRAWHRIVDCLPRHIRVCRGPEELGDLVIHDEDRFWRPRWRSSRRYFAVWRPARHRRVFWDGWGVDAQMATALYRSGNLEPLPGGFSKQRDREIRWLIPRDSVLGYKRGWVSYS